MKWVLRHIGIGACIADKIIEFAPMGMDGFVPGTTLLFEKGRPYKELIQETRSGTVTIAVR